MINLFAKVQNPVDKGKIFVIKILTSIFVLF